MSAPRWCPEGDEGEILATPEHVERCEACQQNARADVVLDRHARAQLSIRLVFALGWADGICASRALAPRDVPESLTDEETTVYLNGHDDGRARDYFRLGYSASDFRAAVLAMTDEQHRQSWVREQTCRKLLGLSYYAHLVEPATGATVAEVAP